MVWSRRSWEVASAKLQFARLTFDYAFSKTVGQHTFKAGVSFIDNPVEGGFFEFSSAKNPSVILANPGTYPILSHRNKASRSVWPGRLECQQASDAKSRPTLGQGHQNPSRFSSLKGPHIGRAVARPAAKKPSRPFQLPYFPYVQFLYPRHYPLLEVLGAELHTPRRMWVASVALSGFHLRNVLWIMSWAEISQISSVFIATKV